MADRHISVPRVFSGGDISELLQRYDICSKANTWNDETKARKLPTLLEGEALALWLDMSETEQANYGTVKEKLLEKLKPAEFVSLDEFHRRKLRPDETPTLYLHELKKALQQAIPGIDDASRKKLLKHQFLSGLPTEVSRQLRMTNETDLETLVDRARLLMTIDDKVCSAAIDGEAVGKESREVQKLQEQVAALTEQVAALTTAATEARRPRAAMRCFVCNKLGHTQYECRSRRQQSRGNIRCFACNRAGHLARDCRSGNDNGAPLRAGRRPTNQ